MKRNQNSSGDAQPLEPNSSKKKVTFAIRSGPPRQSGATEAMTEKPTHKCEIIIDPYGVSHKMGTLEDFK
jgi:hypothetical protein